MEKKKKESKWRLPESDTEKISQQLSANANTHLVKTRSMEKNAGLNSQHQESQNYRFNIPRKNE